MSGNYPYYKPDIQTVLSFLWLKRQAKLVLLVVAAASAVKKKKKRKTNKKKKKLILIWASAIILA